MARRFWDRVRAAVGFTSASPRGSTVGRTDSEVASPVAGGSSGLFGQMTEFAQSADPDRLVAQLSDPQDGQMAALILGQMGERAVPPGSRAVPSRYAAVGGR